MAFKTLLFLFFAILLVTTMVLADEFQDEKAKKPKTPISGKVQTPPLPVNEVYDDENFKLPSFEQSLKKGSKSKPGKKGGGGGGWFSDIFDNIFGSGSDDDSDDSPSPESSLHN